MLQIIYRKQIRSGSIKYSNACISLLLLLMISCVNVLSAQDESQNDKKPSNILVDADYTILDASGDTTVQYLSGNVRAFQDSVYMYCDSAVLVKNFLKAIGSVVIIQDDTITIFSDSLYYYGDSLEAVLYDNVVLENGEQKLFTNSMIYYLDSKQAVYSDTAQLENSRSSLTSIKGIYDVENKIADFYEKVTVIDSNFTLKSDSLRFYTETEKAVFLAPTRIKQKETEIYCESGFYDIDDDIAEFSKNAQYKKEDQSATGDTIKHLGALKLTKLIGNSQFKDTENSGEADIITFNEETDDIIMEGNAHYLGPDKEAKGDHLVYNRDSGAFNIKGKSYISDPPMLIEADSIDYDKSKELGIAEGHVIWKDTSANTTIYCDHMNYNKTESYVLAYNNTGKPYMENLMDKDTFFMSGDTLKSFQLMQTDTTDNTVDTSNYFIAYNNVEIFKNDLQGVCDSLSYSETDSLFMLFKDPVLWSDTSQFSGDTVIIYMQNNVIHQIDFKSNSLILNSSDLIYFNQIKGREVQADFVDGKISEMLVEGNAQSIYYLTDDDKAYVGVNTTECSRIRFWFEDNDIKDIKFFVKPESKMLPMKTADHEGIKLKGFRWITNQRPTSPEDIKQ